MDGVKVSVTGDRAILEMFESLEKFVTKDIDKAMLEAGEVIEKSVHRKIDERITSHSGELKKQTKLVKKVNDFKGTKSIIVISAAKTKDKKLPYPTYLEFGTQGVRLKGGKRGGGAIKARHFMRAGLDEAESAAIGKLNTALANAKV